MPPAHGRLAALGCRLYVLYRDHWPSGADAVASNSIAAVIRDLACCVCNGTATAAAIMVGNELGAGNLAEGKAYGYKLRNFSFVLGSASTAFILAITPLVVRMVKLTPRPISYLTGMMIVMAFI